MANTSAQMAASGRVYRRVRVGQAEPVPRECAGNLRRSDCGAADATLLRRNGHPHLHGTVDGLRARILCRTDASSEHQDSSAILHLCRMYEPFRLTDEVPAFAMTLDKNCSEHELFSCGDDVCIPHSLACNGRANCLYRRDETHCMESTGTRASSKAQVRVP